MIQGTCTCQQCTSDDNVNVHQCHAYVLRSFLSFIGYCRHVMIKFMLAIYSVYYRVSTETTCTIPHFHMLLLGILCLTLCFVDSGEI